MNSYQNIQKAYKLYELKIDLDDLIQDHRLKHRPYRSRGLKFLQFIRIVYQSISAETLQYDVYRVIISQFMGILADRPNMH